VTGMEHAIERAARALYAYREVVGDFPDGTTDWDDLPEPWREEWREAGVYVVRALAEAGLIAPAPLTEERSIVIPNGRGFEFLHLTDFEQFAKEHGGEERTRWVTAWEPVVRAEGDGRAEP